MIKIALIKIVLFSLCSYLYSTDQKATEFDSIKINTSPGDAGVFVLSKGQKSLLGYSPITIYKNDVISERIFLSHIGYKDEKILLDWNSRKIDIVFKPEVIIDTTDFYDNKQCLLQINNIIRKLEKYLKKFRTPLKVILPFRYQFLNGKNVLFVSVQLQDKESFANARAIKRKNGFEGLENYLEEEIQPLVNLLIEHLVETSCLNYIVFRAIYATRSLSFKMSMGEVPWSRTWTHSSSTSYGGGSYKSTYKVTKTVTYSGISLVKLTRAKPINKGKYIDFFYHLKN